MILVLYNIILITNFKLIEMCIKSSPKGRGVKCTDYHNSIQINAGDYSPPFGGGVRGRGHSFLFLCAA